MAGFVLAGLTVLLVAIASARAQLSGSGSGYDPIVHRPDGDTFVDTEPDDELVVSWQPDPTWNLCERYPIGT